MKKNHPKRTKQHTIRPCGQIMRTLNLKHYNTNDIVRVFGLPTLPSVRLNLDHTSSFRRQRSSSSHECRANARNGEATTDSDSTESASLKVSGVLVF